MPSRPAGRSSLDPSPQAPQPLPAALRALHFRRGAGPSIRSQLAARLAGLIRDDYLLPGARLPSVRRLAADLGIHRNTVWATYRRLEAAGLVVAIRGRGVYVRFGRSSRQVPLEAAARLPAAGARARRCRAPTPLRLFLVEPWRELRTALGHELRTRTRLPVQGLHPRSLPAASESGALIAARGPVLARLPSERRVYEHAVQLDMSGGSRELAILNQLPEACVVAIITHCASVRRFARTLAASSGHGGVGLTSPRPEYETAVRRATRIADVVFVDAACRWLVDRRRCRRLVELRLLATRSVEELRQSGGFPRRIRRIDRR